MQGILTFNKINRKIKSKDKRKIKITYKRGPSDIIKGVNKTIKIFKFTFVERGAFVRSLHSSHLRSCDV